MKKGIVRIKLHSPLAAASGYAYAGIIDSDICYDDCGFPYIPSRRLKGCLRDIAENQLEGLLKNKVETIFGKGGNDRLIGFSIGNACIEGRDSLAEKLYAIKSNDDKSDTNLARFTDRQSILDRFTAVKAQTKLVNGVADDLSLRYTRIVHEHSPLTNKAMEFIAEIDYDEEIESDLKIIVRGLRNIGLMRNRGLGSVSCTFEPVFNSDVQAETLKIPECTTCEIKFTLTNTAPLMISGMSDNTSLKYIPGQNVLGLLAGRYLAIPGNTAEDQTFRDLFLNGKTKYTNVLPYISGEIHYPAPANINKLKKTKKLVNVEAVSEMSKEKEDADSEYNPDHGNQPKKLKGKYLAEIGGKYSVHDVDMKIVYHHNHREKDEKGKVVGKLYSHQVVSEDQKFCGRIIVPSDYAKLVIELLSSGDLFFGKSRTAQYGRCRLDSIEPKEYEPEVTNLEAGDEILVTLLSDGIFCNKTGHTIAYEDVVKDIENKLGIKAEGTEDNSFSIISTGMINGYQTKWNLQKQAVPAVLAGSVYALRVIEKATVCEDFVGERNLEGYGQIRVIKASDIGYRLRASDSVSASDEKVLLDETLRKLITDNVIEKIRDAAILKVIGGERNTDDIKINISSSLRGRVTLMLSESIDNNKDWRGRQRNFIERINSIDSVKEKNKIVKALKQELFTDDFKRIDVNKLCSEAMMGVLTGPLSYSKEEAYDKVGALWSDVLMALLVNDKYMEGDEK